ncbi:MAG: S8 family serine peptidase [bacterium]|nr:S8 family serine peptidase [bacterium]
MRFLSTLLCSLSLLLPLTTWAEEGEEACAPLPESAPRISKALDEPVGAEGATVLLVLPRTALDGLDDPSSIFAEGVTIVDSFWSPILCASISRVRGPAGLRAGSLVPGLPEGGTVTPDDTYSTSAAIAEDALSGPDPYRPLQYALDDLDLDEARTISAGAGARIAVLDSAPETDHPDLARVEIVTQIVPNGPAHHGTMVAGILSAKPDNRFGIAGIAPEADILAIPVCIAGPPNRSDACALFDVVRGLDAAWERRAHIVNLSLAGPTNPLLQAATDRLDSLGVSLVAAVGNDSSEEALYPAAYTSVIGVGATGREGAPYPEGNRGPGLDSPHPASTSSPPLRAAGSPSQTERAWPPSMCRAFSHCSHQPQAISRKRAEPFCWKPIAIRRPAAR